jgi:hypothetical protein
MLFAADGAHSAATNLPVNRHAFHLPIVRGISRRWETLTGGNKEASRQRATDTEEDVEEGGRPLVESRGGLGMVCMVERCKSGLDRLIKEPNAGSSESSAELLDGLSIVRSSFPPVAAGMPSSFSSPFPSRLGLPGRAGD